MNLESLQKGESEKRTLIASWYSGPTDSSSLAPLQDAYEKAVEYFKTNLTKDECKRLWIDSKSSLSDVQKAVQEARETYEGSKKSKARLWLSRLSSRVMYYNTLSEHHPEYVSLVWGAMKFLLVVFLNQEELITELSKALSSIADALPRAKIHTILYPTEMMKHTVAMLYACVIRFLHRAMCWYKEGKLKHMVSAFTRPASLRFKDLVEEISELSNRADKLAAASAHAELRDLHATHSATKVTVNELHDNLKTWTSQTSILDELNEVKREQQLSRHLIAQMEERILARLEYHHGIHTSRYIDTNRQIYDLQYSQILASVASTSSLLSPNAALKHCRSMRKHRRLYGVPDLEVKHATPLLQGWASRECSSIILIKGSLTLKNITKDLATDVVDLILKSKTAVVWVLNSPRAVPAKEPPAIEVLKQLVLQVMQLNTNLMNERSLGISATCFQSAKTEKDWFDLLGSVMAGITRLFIIVDIEASRTRSKGSSTWPAAFLSLFQKLSARNIKCVVKVALVYYQGDVTVPGKAKKNVNIVSIGKHGSIASHAGIRSANAVRSARAPRSRGSLALQIRSGDAHTL
ncbi:hypothetical protein G7Y89_g3948 [Cudoniella acicularis]|uniref:DUF7708 domain-containing protein n=1 Tax=Cudoniella acicularis TaxID=354080 RepID=A0A8H4RQD9_9HELO|nr:hypothetical protein G7Y89_g3948 [Cudoniella acicularis]